MAMRVQQVRQLVRNSQRRTVTLGQTPASGVLEQLVSQSAALFDHYLHGCLHRVR